MHRHLRIMWVVTTVLAFALVAAACGGDDDSVSTSGTSTTNAQQASTGGSAGADGNDVLDVQRELNTLGCEAGPLDGELGPDTLGAIRRFQSAAGIAVDGIVGPNTRAALSNAAATGTPRCPVGPPPPAPPKPSTPASNTPPCTEAAIRPVVTASLLAGETLVKLNEFNCAITWAVAQPTVTSAAAPSGTQVTVLLRWNGTAWQAVDQGVYCDNGSVPAAIFAKACQSN
jgi:Putative peptidoglycan binding domain